MPLTKAQTDADFAAMLADLPETVVFGGQTVACARHWPVEVVYTRLRNAFGADYLASVSSRVAAWTSVPAIDDVGTYSGQSLRVLEIERSPDDVQIVLHLGAEYGRGR